MSPVVENAIRRCAAEQGIPEGTLVDSLVWKALVKPDEAKLKAGGFSQEELERIFAEEALELLDGEADLDDLASNITFKDENGFDLPDIANLRKVHALVKRWKITRLIEKDHQEAIVACLYGAALPSILENHQVETEWFQPG